jgi:ABC-type uncharacterized transport system fused permease/ATPase subunit
MKEKKAIMPRLKIMEVSDSIGFPYQQRQSVEVTRARAQRLHKMKFKIETTDEEMNFKVTRTA